MINADDERQELIGILQSLRQFALALSGSRQDADDLLQATAERLLTKDVPKDVNLKKWAFRLCKNIYIDDYRARKVRLNARISGKLGREDSVDGERVVIG